MLKKETLFSEGDFEGDFEGDLGLMPKNIFFMHA